MKNNQQIIHHCNPMHHTIFICLSTMKICRSPEFIIFYRLTVYMLQQTVLFHNLTVYYDFHGYEGFTNLNEVGRSFVTCGVVTLHSANDARVSRVMKRGIWTLTQFQQEASSNQWGIVPCYTDLTHMKSPQKNIGWNVEKMIWTCLEDGLFHWTLPFTWTVLDKTWDIPMETWQLTVNSPGLANTVPVSILKLKTANQIVTLNIFWKPCYKIKVCDSDRVQTWRCIHQSTQDVELVPKLFTGREMSCVYPIVDQATAIVGSRLHLQNLQATCWKKTFLQGNNKITWTFKICNVSKAKINQPYVDGLRRPFMANLLVVDPIAVLTLCTML